MIVRHVLILFICLLQLSFHPSDDKQKQSLVKQPKNMVKNKIIYVYDPMCGWCFGFGKVMNEFVAKHNDSFDFEIVSGGMVVGEREGPIGDFADYILQAYHKVESYSGIKFGDAYLNQLKTKSIWSSSVKPSIALETFKTFNQLDAVKFGHQIQEAYFIEGLDLRNDQVYSQLIKPYQIDSAAFIAKLNSEEVKKTTFDWYQKTAAWGVTGYPTVILVHQSKYYAIARGFSTLTELEATIKGVINP